MLLANENDLDQRELTFLKFRSDFLALKRAPLLLRRLLSSRFVCIFFLSFLSFFLPLFSISILSSSRTISPWLQVFQSFPISRSNSSRHAGKPTAAQSLPGRLPRDECDIRERIENDERVFPLHPPFPPPRFARLPPALCSTVAISHSRSLYLSISLSTALKTTELRFDANEDSFVVPSRQMVHA